MAPGIAPLNPMPEAAEHGIDPATLPTGTTDVNELQHALGTSKGTGRRLKGETLNTQTSEKLAE